MMRLTSGNKSIATSWTALACLLLSGVGFGTFSLCTIAFMRTADAFVSLAPLSRQHPSQPFPMILQEPVGSLLSEFYIGCSGPNTAKIPGLLRPSVRCYSTPNNDEEDETNEKANPYADPNYPDLEFIDYSDPNYQVDMGLDDAVFMSQQEQNEADAEELESMREERRVRNDEFQFQSYFSTALQSGKVFQGEWTVYKCLFPENDESSAAPPRLLRAASTYTVTSQASKQSVSSNQDSDTSGTKDEQFSSSEGIWHSEELIVEDEDDAASSLLSGSKDDFLYRTLTQNTFWPVDEPLQPRDFRGPQGNMCVSNAYTIAVGFPCRNEEKDKSTTRSTSTFDTMGPFAEYRAEVGLVSDDLRFRIKLDYAAVAEGTEKAPLELRSLTVCREMQQPIWQQRKLLKEERDKLSVDMEEKSDESTINWMAYEEALFGIPGADNGLYDPPPVSDPENYLQVDLDGHATALFPYRMEQASLGEDADDRTGFVISLDWTPTNMRYQVDRKMLGGPKLLGLRTLELSSVLAKQAETYRPRDGGANMRQ